MTDRKEINIEVPVLARIEGEGALELMIRDGCLEELRLRIYEPPRLFEKFLEGREYTDVPDLVARICGICPVAYQMSAVHAIERIFNADPGPWVRAMRRVMYCGEWIESHALHIHLLAAPDFLDCSDVIAMAKRYPEEVRRGIRLQELGNRILRLLGGRSVHPVGVRAGGFFRAPSVTEINALRAELEGAVEDARALVGWTASLDLQAPDQEFTSVALQHPEEYPMNEGRLVSSTGLDISIDEYPQHFEERHVPHSTALHAFLHGSPYLVGPLARLNLNMHLLPERVRQVLGETGLQFPSANMFHSIVARAAELYFAILEAIRLLDEYHPPETPYIELLPRAGTGCGCTEAPRGILWHRYRLDDDGRVVNATIIPPTSQNQARIEEDLRISLQAFGLDRGEDELRQLGETVIRNYDPCISCSTHFLRLQIEHR